MPTEILKKPIVYKCEFISNKNETCVFFERNEEKTKKDGKSCPKLKYKRGTPQTHGACALQIDSNVTDIVGKWQINTYFSRNNQYKLINNEYTRVEVKEQWFHNFELHLTTVIYFSITTFNNLNYTVVHIL